MTLSYVASPSPNHGPRPPGRPVDMLVLHYTGMVDQPTAFHRLRDPAAGVSAHYLVDEDGTVHHMVPEHRRAWHAGRGCWRCDTDINSRSIGVEIVNPGHEFGYRPFPERQIRAVMALCRDILGRQRAITPAGVVGHSDIAPARKEDPGELFPWSRLAAAGIGLWPAAPLPVPPPLARVTELLRLAGYCPDAAPLPKVLAAVQRRYRPARIDGRPDDETLARLGAVVRGLRRAGLTAHTGA